MVVAPDAKLAAELCTPEQRAAFDEYLTAVKSETEIERLSTEREKTGVFLGSYAINPVTGERIPIWAADYVLADYGTGAIMAVPGQDTAGLGVRGEVRAADRADRAAVGGLRGQGVHRRRAGHQQRERRGQPGRAGGRGGQGADHRLAGGQGAGRADDQLPAARLAAEPAAVLGCADPDHPLPVLWRGAGPGRPAADGAARPARRRPGAEGRLAAGGGPRLGRGRLPEVRWQGRARHRHDGHLRRLVLVLPALPVAGLHRGPVRPGRRPSGGCRCTSTSAARSTPYCISCTRGSSSRRCTTWGC